VNFIFTVYTFTCLGSTLLQLLLRYIMENFLTFNTVVSVVKVF